MKRPKLPVLTLFAISVAIWLVNSVLAAMREHWFVATGFFACALCIAAMALVFRHMRKLEDAEWERLVNRNLQKMKGNEP